ncbi:MAG TPA: DUF5995 family protein [Polyangiaceae bacterium]|jgi:hypothetical protein|nr:DUF5995 family protein [Polyangiaceae bacterium]
MTSSDSSLLAIASKGPVDDYVDVLARLQALEAELDPSDGLFWFHRLYRLTTAAVREASRKHRFADARCIERLHCHFAGLYFVALSAHLSDPGTGPSAWAPLFQARTRTDITACQFAVAGLNAHLNRDLPVALVNTCLELDREPGRETPLHGDYQHVGAIQEHVLRDVNAWLPAPEPDAPERARAELTALLELWSARRARDAAWIAAEVRWALRGSPLVARHHLDALDRMVELASRALLLPGSLERRSRPAPGR